MSNQPFQPSPLAPAQPGNVAPTQPDSQAEPPSAHPQASGPAGRARAAKVQESMGCFKSFEASDVAACRCGAATHPERADLCAKGHVLPGFAGPALKTGRRSAIVAAGLMPEQADAAAALAERVAAIVADLGGPDAVSHLAVGLIERHARLEMVDEYLWSNLQQLGLLTGKGRTRAAMTAWLSVVDRLHKSALALGLERRAKAVRSLSEVLNGK